MGLGFFATVIAIVAIVYGNEDLSKLAVNVHEQIVMALFSRE